MTNSEDEHDSAGMYLAGGDAWKHPETVWIYKKPQLLGR
jgi:hypothetical protein